MTAAPDLRHAVVTGAAGGIGRAIAVALLQQGYQVHALDRAGSALDALADAGEGRLHPYAVDLAQTAQLDQVQLSLRASLDGACALLVNNVGISHVVPFADISDRQLEELWAVNVAAPLRLTRALLPALAKGGPGAVVNIASELALVGQAGYVAYSATKGAILAWSRALAMELAPQRIRVNAVCPGPVDTPMLAAEFALAEDPAAARAGELATVPLGRLGTPADIAAMVCFLAGPEAGYITGASFTVDGGKTAR